MRCAEALKILEWKGDGEGFPVDARDAGAHLGACPACAARLAALDRLREILASLPEEAPPENLSRAIADAARFRTPRSVGRSAPPAVSFARVAAALLISLSGGYFGLRYSATRSPEPPASTRPAGGDPLARDTAAFRLVPPGSPGALYLALMDEVTR